MSNKSYHVALSYAAEQREYVGEVARFLKSYNVRVFYDQDEEISLWGKNLLESFQEIFETGKATFAVLFISKEYVKKAFPKAELGFALSYNVHQDQEYILLARFDKTPTPGLLAIEKYINLKDISSEIFAKMIVKKLQEKGAYFGPDTLCNPQEFRITSGESNSEVTMIVKDEKEVPISGAKVCLIHKNGTHRLCNSNEIGKVTFPMNKNNNALYTIFIAHKEFPATVINDFTCKTNIEIILKKKIGINSTIFDKGSGYIPGIEGRLNPILDSHKQTYLYADNISINDDTPQPAYFKFGENISIVDSLGKASDIRIKRIIQRCAILDYIVHGAE